jgi:hypothetical protein
MQRDTVRDVAEQLRDILAGVERGELVAEPGLVARLEGAATSVLRLWHDERGAGIMRSCPDAGLPRPW